MTQCPIIQLPTHYSLTRHCFL